MTNIYIGGHRGLGGTDSEFAQKRNGNAPIPSENTLDSLIGALKKGVTFVETDLIATSDNELVLTHSNDPRQHIRIPEFVPQDKTYIDEMTLAEATDLRLGPTGDAHMPSFRQLLRAVKALIPANNPRPFTLNLELKGVQGTPRDSAKSVPALALKIIREENFPLEWIRFSSFSLDMLEDMSKREPKARLGMLYDLTPEQGGTAGEPMFEDTKEPYVAFTVDSVKETLRRIPQLEAVHPEIRSLTPETAAFAAQKNLAIATWGWLENSPLKDPVFAAAAERAVRISLEKGVRELSIITDHTADFREFLAYGQAPKKQALKPALG